MKNITTENYLKAIYELQEVQERVSTTVLAKKMDISPASATEMIKRLTGQGWIKHQPYAGVQLTNKGIGYALKIIRHHRLWELFLYKILDFSWDEIHQEAEQFEHIMSEKMEEKLDQILGKPRFDPHGHPIPARDGTLPEIAGLLPLSSLDLNESGTVAQVSDFDDEFLIYIKHVGIVLNQAVIVKEKRKFDGSLLVSIDDNELVLSEQTANNIFVKRN